MTLATVLLLIAISQRFKTRGVRVALLLIAALLLCFPVYHILTLPASIVRLRRGDFLISTDLAALSLAAVFRDVELQR